MSATPWRLSPSDLTFLWEECPRCFYLKVVHGLDRPGMRLPAVFNSIDAQMKRCFVGRRTETLDPELPPGIVSHGEKWVQSRVIDSESGGQGCYLRGKIDSAFTFDDGSYGLVDYKTSKMASWQRRFYSTQLHAYAFALEQPGERKLSLTPISRFGLLVFSPEAFSHVDPGRAILEGGLRWLEVERNETKFLSFLQQVLRLLNRPAPPEPGPSCSWCSYLREVAPDHFD